MKQILEKFTKLLGNKKAPKKNFEEEDGVELDSTDSEDLDDVGSDDFDSPKSSSNSKEKKPMDKKIVMIGGIVVLVAGAVLLKPMILPEDDYEAPSDFNTTPSPTPVQQIEPKLPKKELIIKKEPKKEIIKETVSEVKPIEDKVIEEVKASDPTLPKEEVVPPKTKENETKMIETVKKTVSDKEELSSRIDNASSKLKDKILKKDFSHDPEDTKDPFINEYEGTIESKAMRTELSENIKLMKEYVQFLETQKLFKEAKAIYEKEASKDIFDKEVTDIKTSFSKEMTDMKDMMNKLQQENQALKNDMEKNANKINNDINKMAGNTELVIGENGEPINDKYGLSKSKQNEILNNIKGAANEAFSQKIYRVGSKYILEETDVTGKAVVYKQGNLYKGAIIKEISPTLIKIESEGETAIIPVSNGSTTTAYVPIEIKMPAKLESTEGKAPREVNNDSNKITNYTDEINKRANDSQNNKQDIKSKFF